MKKLLIAILSIIVIPYLVVSSLATEEKIADLRFYYVDNLKVRVKRVSKDKIEEVPLEEYVMGVLAGEMPIEFDIEALKSQAVAARSYVLKEIETNQEKEYDVVDTVLNQVYLDQNELKEKFSNNYIENINKLKEAVNSTRGQYLSYDNKIAQTLFFSTSTGKTENSEEIFSTALPYLVSVDSKWDEEVSPVFNDSYTFSLNEFLNILGLKNNNKVTTKVLETTSTGRIKRIKINEREFSGSEVYSALNLRSTFFSIEQNNNTINVYTKGFGHGVGMSQYGALAMAKRGYKYDEILKYYYQGTEIKKI
ncbi:MAG: stage II sporulation protein D [Bacilli bacterium]|nr:stage II sporulation protein D [Bacilli bacterium]